MVDDRAVFEKAPFGHVPPEAVGDALARELADEEARVQEMAGGAARGPGGEPPRSGAEAHFRGLVAYARAGLLPHPGKAKRRARRFELWGAAVDGVRGVVRATHDITQRAVVLTLELLALKSFPTTTRAPLCAILTPLGSEQRLAQVKRPFGWVFCRISLWSPFGSKLALQTSALMTLEFALPQVLKARVGGSGQMLRACATSPGRLAKVDSLHLSLPAGAQPQRDRPQRTQSLRFPERLAPTAMPRCVYGKVRHRGDCT